MSLTAGVLIMFRFETHRTGSLRDDTSVVTERAGARRVLLRAETAHVCRKAHTDRLHVKPHAV